jgi:hypothetical protein
VRANHYSILMRLNVALVFCYIGLQYAQPFLLDVLKLPTVDGPTEHGEDRQYQQDGHRNQDVENFHDVVAASRADGAESKRIQYYP